jgi:tRNA-dihydrouridine synthase B
VKSRVKIPVVVNGDIDTPQKAKRVLDRTRADAVMIGRAAQGRPWIFREIAHFLGTGSELPAPEIAEIHGVLVRHLRNLYAFYGEYVGVRVARKHIAWYTKSLVGVGTFRQEINRLESAGGQLAAVDAFFAGLAERGKRLTYVTECAA